MGKRYKEGLELWMRKTSWRALCSPVAGRRGAGKLLASAVSLCSETSTPSACPESSCLTAAPYSSWLASCSGRPPPARNGMWVWGQRNWPRPARGMKHEAYGSHLESRNAGLSAGLMREDPCYCLQLHLAPLYSQAHL